MSQTWTDKWTSEDGSVLLYCGDSIAIMAAFPRCLAVDAVITDPVWPDAAVNLGTDDPYRLWAAAWFAFPQCQRVAVQLGCDSDPTMLAGMRDRWSFFRAVFLELACPHYKGRLLYTGDIAYLFGEPPASRPGFHIIPGKFTATDANGRESKHPCPRKLSHVEFLVRRWGGERVLDPFMGSGTTGVACVRNGSRFVGIEINPEYYAEAKERIQLELDAKRKCPMLPGMEPEALSGREG